MSRPEIVIGADIGGRRDHTGVAVVRLDEMRGKLPVWRLLAIERAELGAMDYPTTALELADLVADLMSEGWRRVSLAIDTTGLGAPIGELCRYAMADESRPGGSLLGRGGALVQCHLHGGAKVTGDDTSGVGVPIRDLVDYLRVLLESRRLILDPLIPADDVSTFLAELEAFTVKSTATEQTSYEAVRESEHDDLVVSVGLGLWWSEQCRRRFRKVRTSNRAARLQVARAPYSDLGVYGRIGYPPAPLNDPRDYTEGIDGRTSWKHS